MYVFADMGYLLPGRRSAKHTPIVGHSQSTCRPSYWSQGAVAVGDAQKACRDTHVVLYNRSQISRP